MSSGRCLLTERETEILLGGADADTHTRNHHHNVVFRTRERMRALSRDLDVLREHHPEAYQVLMEQFQEHLRNAEEEPEGIPA